MTPTDTVRREIYLLRFSWAAQDFPKYARLKRELRTELNAVASEVGMRQAITDLGHPRVLADGYLAELGHTVPRWNTGAWWGSLAIVGLVALWLVFGLGSLNTLEQVGGGTATATFLGATTTYTFTDDTISSGSHVTWQLMVFFVLTFAVPFVLGARFWRLWSTPRSRSLATPGPASAASRSRPGGRATTAAGRDAGRPRRGRRSSRRCRCSSGSAGSAA